MASGPPLRFWGLVICWMICSSEAERLSLRSSVLKRCKSSQISQSSRRTFTSRIPLLPRRVLGRNMGIQQQQLGQDHQLFPSIGGLRQPIQENFYSKNRIGSSVTAYESRTAATSSSSDSPPKTDSRRVLLRKIEQARRPEELRLLVSKLRTKQGQMKRDEYRRVVAATAAQGLVDDVKELLLSARDNGRETIHVHNAAISGLGRAGKWQQALEILHSIPIQRDTVSYNAALTACQANKANHQISKLLTEMAQASLRRNTITYNIVLKERAKSISLDSALKVLDEMDDAGVRKDVFTFTNAISACAPSGNWEIAFNLLRMMRQNGIRPTNAPYSAAISVCEKAGVWEQALEVLKELHSLGLKPSQITLSAAISAFRHQPSLVNAVKTFQFMKVQGSRANVKTYGSMMTAYTSKGLWENALDLLQEMRGSLTAPTAQIVNLALEACVRAGETREALSLLRSAKSQPDLPYDAVSYQICMQGIKRRMMMMARGRNDDEATTALYDAQNLLLQMENEESGAGTGGGRDGDFKVTTRVFNTYLAIVGEVEGVDSLLDQIKQMETKGVEKDVFTYNIAIKACGKDGRWEEALSLFKEIENMHSLTPDARTYASCISACAPAVPDVALELFYDIKKKRERGGGEDYKEEGIYYPDAFVYAAALDACATKKDGMQAITLLEDMERNNVQKTLPVYTNAIEALKHSTSTMDDDGRTSLRDVAMKLYLQAENLIKESGEDRSAGAIAAMRTFRAKNVDLRQKHWKETWNKLRDNVPIEPEGQFTERFSRPAEFASFANEDEHDDRNLESGFEISEADEIKVVMELKRQGLVQEDDDQANDDLSPYPSSGEIIQDEQRSDDQEKPKSTIKAGVSNFPDDDADLDELWDDADEEDVNDEAWESIDPLEIPEIAEMMTMIRKTDDN